MAESPMGEVQSGRKARAGQALYTGLLLSMYDAFVLGLSNRYFWRCPSSLLLRHYDANVSAAHLEVGVGTGYFLDRCRFPVPQPSLALYDLMEHPLQVTARRISRYRPAVYQCDVLQPSPIEPESFDSIGLNYVLHCLPGTIRSKGIVFDHLTPLLRPGGVIFGSTVLSNGVRHTPVAQALLAVYNRTGIFTNRDDDLDGLHEILAARFGEYRVEILGSVAVFTARR